MTETTSRAGTPELFEGAFWSDPYPAYAHLREAEPVREVHLPDGPIWLVTRYADVKEALTDPRLSKDWRYTLPPEQRAAAPGNPVPMILLMDPPDHTRLRKLVSRSFTARRMAGLRPRVEQIAAGLLDALPAGSTVDLMESFASPLPVEVICELLGVPAADRTDFGAWSRVMIDESPVEDKMAASDRMVAYLTGLIDAARARPDDALLSALTQVSESDGDRLSQDELVGMAMLLLIAGHETTANLIGNAVLGLLTHPGQLALLRERPELLPGAVEEFLRWDSPVANAPVRYAAEDVPMGGATIPAGAVVMLGLAAANRDGARFPDAERLDVTRDAGGHVAFGHGLHFCLGAQLARIQGEVAIGALLARHPELELAADPAEIGYRHSTLVRGVTSLPVRLGRA
ncbi:MAG TPA: cytochrome P450 [Pseudonocardia sp.]|nr:cytochrome P450 [Pseudonocardia sp.]